MAPPRGARGSPERRRQRREHLAPGLADAVDVARREVQVRPREAAQHLVATVAETQLLPDLARTSGVAVAVQASTRGGRSRSSSAPMRR